MRKSAADITEEARTLLDFVRQSSAGLRGVSKVAAESVLQCLMDEGMDPSRLLTRVVNSSDPAELFDFLYDAIENQQPERRPQLLDAIVKLPRWVWNQEILSDESVAARFDCAEDFAHLLKHHLEALLYREEYEGFSSDKYWLQYVRRFIVKGDFRRAWDELRKAERGFFIGGKEHRPRFGKYEPEYYCFAATRDTIAILGQELHAAMVNREILPEISEGQATLVRFLAIKEYFRVQRNARRRERVGNALP